MGTSISRRTHALVFLVIASSGVAGLPGGNIDAGLAMLEQRMAKIDPKHVAQKDADPCEFSKDRYQLCGEDSVQKS